jgi:ubiquinone/menaquinone biosynthesis C-methylase UbiE
VKTEFDEFAQNYQKIHNESIKISGADNYYFAKYKIEEVYRHEKSSKINNILDFGCGVGTTTKILKEFFSKTEVAGVDISKDSIEKAKELSLDIIFESYEGNKLNFEDNTFDFIFIANVFHHVPFNQHEEILKELVRVLKPKGRLYLFEHNPFNPLTQKVVKDCIFDKNAILLTPFYAKKIINKKFENIKTFFTLFIPRNKIFQKILFMEKFLYWLPLGAQYYIKASKPD